jgi:hypothetical protein
MLTKNIVSKILGMHTHGPIPEKYLDAITADLNLASWRPEPPRLHHDSPFLKDLEGLINKHCMEAGSNTPDFILALFLARILEDANALIRERDKWYSVDLRPGNATPAQELYPGQSYFHANNPNIERAEVHSGITPPALFGRLKPHEPDRDPGQTVYPIGAPMDDLFKVHMLNEEGKKKAATLASNFDSLLQEVEEIVGSGPSREMSCVKTHLELASFYAKKAMAMKPQNQLE